MKPPLVPLSLLVEFEEAAIATTAALADDAGDGCRRVFQMAERGMDPHAFLRERKQTRHPVLRHCSRVAGVNEPVSFPQQSKVCATARLRGPLVRICRMQSLDI